MTGDQDTPGCSPQEVSFTAFILSLSTAALQHLGAKIEESQDACVDLCRAQQTIDILDMLEKKTRGNLSEQESKLLGNILHDLRMRFVQESRKREC